MNNNNNTSLKENKKEEEKLNFVSFENRKVRREEIEKKTNNHASKKPVFHKKNLVITLIIIVMAFLFVISSMCNEYFLYGKKSKNYNAVNEFPEVYATIEPDSRPTLFRKIGYDVVIPKIQGIFNRDYASTYAYRKNGDKNDHISVYYDKNNKVKYLTFTLNYKKEDYNTSVLTGDSNAIISNFVNVIIEKNKLKSLKKSDHASVNYNKINITYNLTFNDDYYTINVTLK